MILLLFLLASSGFFIFRTTEDDIIIVDYNITSALKHKSTYIFFVETSGKTFLNIRQACAVESTGKHNPRSNIQVLMFSSGPVEDHFELNRTYSNINITRANFEEIFSGTPLEKWYRERTWNGNANAILHLSDASRLSLIWKFGGIYLDLDIIMLKSMSGLRNFVIKQNRDILCNGIFGFDRGHPFVYNCMYNFGRRCLIYNNSFGCGGPDMFTKIFKSVCNINKEIQDGLNCHITVLPVVSAFPISYHNWTNYFNESCTEDVGEKMKSSYMIHVWNYLSSKKLLKINSGTIYEKAALSNCPVVYNKVLKDNSFL